jgi:hypothetical protein
MSIERLQAGAQSATFYTFSEVEDDSLLTTTEWSALPDGKLKRLLNATYLNC